jgi:hypothetical protein
MNEGVIAIRVPRGSVIATQAVRNQALVETGSE